MAPPRKARASSTTASGATASGATASSATASGTTGSRTTASRAGVGGTRGNGNSNRPLRASGKIVPEDARRHNRALVLQSLFREGPVSRADLARATGLTPPSASDLVAELLAAGPREAAR